MIRPPMDAWEQLHTLVETNTTEQWVRPDIEVIGSGTDRGVELVLWDKKTDPLMKRTFRTTGSRNVATMRKLAAALNEACDFVERVNPQWARRAKEQ